MHSRFRCHKSISNFIFATIAFFGSFSLTGIGISSPFQAPRSATSVHVNAPLITSFTYPIGVPTVPSGLDPERTTPSSSSQCPNWPNALSPDCWYIDNTNVNCSDAGSNRGYPALPRCTLPANGSVFHRIEIVGGGAAYAFTSRNWDSTGGTESDPSVINGIRDNCLDPTLVSAKYGDDEADSWPNVSEPAWTNCPVIGQGASDYEMQYQVNWVIVQGINWNRVSMRASTPYFSNNGLYRWNHSYGARGAHSNGVQANFSGTASYNINNVFYKTEVTDWCAMDAATEVDCLGGMFGDGAAYAWAMDNVWGDINGDSVRTGTNAGTPGSSHTAQAFGVMDCALHSANRAHNIYIARNFFYRNGENAVDVKDSFRAVFSQNTAVGPFNLGATSTGGGGAYSVHNHATETWIIYNLIDTSPIGISTTTDNAGTEDSYHIGNVIVNIAHDSVSYDPNNGDSTNGTVSHIRDAAKGACVYQHNTAYSNDFGIQIQNAAGMACTLMDNIVSTLTTAGASYSFTNTTMRNAATLKANLAHVTLGRVASVGSSQYTTWTAFNAVPGATSTCVGCLLGDPLFVNPATYNFALGSTSPAKDTGSGDETYYDLYFSSFGVGIKRDFTGATRPQNGLWDIGAYEAH